MENDKEKLIESMIMKSMESISRVCRMCGCDFVGYKLICDSAECAAAWRIHCENLDRKYATNLTSPPRKTFLVFYEYDKNEKK
jgi:hypothetical protein